MKRIKSKQAQKGAALVEFAIVLPFLLLILMGMIEFGVLFYNKQVLTNATREGARAGIAYSDETEIENIVQGYCQDRLISLGSTPSVVVTTSGVGGSYASDLSVSVTYIYSFLFQELLKMNSDLQLKAATVMKMEPVAGT